MEKSLPRRAFLKQTAKAAADRAGEKPYDFMRDLLIEEKAMVGMIAFMIKSEEHTGHLPGRILRKKI